MIVIIDNDNDDNYCYDVCVDDIQDGDDDEEEFEYVSSVLSSINCLK
jgi:hypothetical protein